MDQVKHGSLVVIALATALAGCLTLDAPTRAAAGDGQQAPPHPVVWLVDPQTGFHYRAATAAERAPFPVGNGWDAGMMLVENPGLAKADNATPTIAVVVASPLLPLQHLTLSLMKTETASGWWGSKQVNQTLNTYDTGNLTPSGSFHLIAGNAGYSGGGTVGGVEIRMGTVAPATILSDVGRVTVPRLRLTTFDTVMPGTPRLGDDVHGCADVNATSC